MTQRKREDLGATEKLDAGRQLRFSRLGAARALRVSEDWSGERVLSTRVRNTSAGVTPSCLQLKRLRLKVQKKNKRSMNTSMLPHATMLLSQLPGHRRCEPAEQEGDFLSSTALRKQTSHTQHSLQSLLPGQSPSENTSKNPKNGTVPPISPRRL